MKEKLSHSQSGFTLIEVMVTVFILSIGILGMAGLQSVGVKESQNTYFRAQADLLVSDLIDRMRANQVAARDTSASAYAFTGTTTAVDNCSAAADCNPAQMAGHDLREWQAAITASRLPSANGVVTRPTLTVPAYTIQLFWDENRDGSTGTGCNPANSADLSCIQIAVEI